jgi:endonuclease/exonuclease/phosphatase (EEP) superfamily protein YafD
MNTINRILLYTTIAVNALFALGLLMAAYGGAINPATTTVPQMVAMTFPICIVAEIVALVATLFINRRVALIPLCALLLAMPSILTVSPVHFPTKLNEEEKQRSFTVMTYNAYSFIDYELNPGTSPDPNATSSRSLQQIIDEQPDIVCLQECQLPSYRFREQTDSIKKIYPYRSTRQESVVPVVVLSKYPIKDVPTQEHPMWETASYSAFRIDMNGRELLVVNCHLQSIGLSDDDKGLYRELTNTNNIESPTREQLSLVKHTLLSKLSAAFRVRAEQAKYIREFLDMNPGNTILTGDFNDIQLNYAYRLICGAGMRDAYSDGAFGPTITYIDNHFYFHIDQILYRGDMRAVDAKRGSIKSSDHYPVTATFLWNKSAEE